MVGGNCFGAFFLSKGGKTKLLRGRTQKSCCWGLGKKKNGDRGGWGRVAPCLVAGELPEQPVPADAVAKVQAGLCATGEAAGAEGRAETRMGEVQRASGCLVGEAISVTAERDVAETLIK